MSVQGLQSSLEKGRQIQGVEICGLASPLLRHLAADMFPKNTKFRHLVARDIVGHRHAGELDDTAFDGIHQREIVHCPGEQRSLGVT